MQGCPKTSAEIPTGTPKVHGASFMDQLEEKSYLATVIFRDVNEKSGIKCITSLLMANLYIVISIQPR